MSHDASGWTNTKGKENYFWYFLENKYHTVRATEQTLKDKENYFWFFESECHTVRATGQTQ